MATRRKADTAKRQQQERKASKTLRQTVLARRSGPWTMSVPEAGKKYYGLGRNASYEAAQAGQIPTIKVNKLLRVPVHMIERLLGGPVAAE
jgi:hypothetical protein